MNKWQIVGIVGAIIAIIGMFLPWATVSASEIAGGSASVYGYISIFLWICAILTLVGAAIPKAWGGIIALVFGILGFLDAIWNQIGIYTLKNMYSDVKISMGYGGYIIMVGFIIAFIGGILQYISIRKENKAKAEVPPPPAPPAEEEKKEEENTQENSQ